MLNVKFESDFDPEKLTRKMAEDGANQIRAKLIQAGLTKVSVSAVQRGGEWVYDFSGPDDQTEKAKQILGAK